MEQPVRYEYMDQGSISKRLKCPLCSLPLLDPVSIRCRHTFCRKCIQDRLAVDPSCPECKKDSSIDHFMEVPLPFLDMLDELPVKCVECQEKGLRRIDFQDHLDEVCPETAVRCSAADIQCPWTGRVKELQFHVESCHYEQLRPTLTKLIAENLSFHRQAVKQKIRIDSPDGRRGPTLEDAATIAALKDEVTFLKNVICHRNPKLEEQLHRTEKNSKIDLRQLGLSDLDMGIVVQEAVIDGQCTELELQKCNITDQALSILVHCLDGNTSLTKLNLGHNPITDVGVGLLAELLGNNSTVVEKLHLVNIRITEQGLSYVAEMLKRNQTLTSLSLFQNRLTDQGIQHLAEALATQNTRIQGLFIQSNKGVTDASIDKLITMIRCNQSLSCVDLRNCGFTSSGIQRLQQAASGKKGFELTI